MTKVLTCPAGLWNVDHFGGTGRGLEERCLRFLPKSDCTVDDGLSRAIQFANPTSARPSGFSYVDLRPSILSMNAMILHLHLFIPLSFAPLHSS
jgi:hypothetical protein